ncbi:AAA family ATPase [Acinetobacter pollinis]|uniref:AAA family ATPase n=1 Tax=Acinetobacter pollinis TaxID=2605270 RepID=UPI0018A2E1FE|nr:AAA family ATPase [Acinetobacter pollinis]MBF7691294.1 AAA family ATPase [Acinetobacter pollinis]MBF7698694.1 AAA family ATPase [Acinetobacter pollinis]
MALIITIANRKGGVGKTTIATNLAVALQNKGRTLLVDADEQRSSFKWNDYRESKIDVLSAHKNLLDVLEPEVKEYDFILIDLAGRDSEAFREALLITDKLIIPTQASLLDLDVLPYIDEQLKKVHIDNKELKTFIVINKAPTNPRSSEIEQARSYISDYPNFKLLQTVLRDRKQFRDAIVESKSVLEMQSSKARDEFNEMLIEIL